MYFEYKHRFSLKMFLLKMFFKKFKNTLEVVKWTFYLILISSDRSVNACIMKFNMKKNKDFQYVRNTVFKKSGQIEKFIVKDYGFKMCSFC